MAGDQQDMISVDDFMARMNNHVAADPSPRNPRINTQSSHADQIEAAYQADGHKTWGYVIYRTTYEDDDDWAEFMRRLRLWAEEAMEIFNGRDVLDQMTWTVFDDREHFDGMDTATVRAHFREWAEHAIRSEQPSRDDATPAIMGRSPRYRYCVQVDAAALEATVHDAPAPPAFDPDKQGWVKVIDGNWVCRSENPIWIGRPPDPTTYEPIDGLTEEHVGWVKCPATSVMTEYYMLFQDVNMYMVSYRRPPAVVGYPWN